MLNRIKRLFVTEKGLPQAQIEELRRLPSGERLAALAAALHERCVTSAAGFVGEEQRRADSPFREIPQADLFHELLVMNYWILERTFQGKRPALMAHVYGQYNNSFIWGLEQPHKELLDSMRGKFRTYERSWDEHTGHQDVFARQAIGIIFGERGCAEVPRASFWLISHADQTMKDFAEFAGSLDQLLQDAT
jgi:hypothetical protein